ncbi:MAG: ABC transporter permease [Acidobacteriota bacterium]|nr:ABC transporter permease [Acidobacteriota bacterium]
MAAALGRSFLFLARYLLVLWLAVTLLFIALNLLKGNPVELFLDSRVKPEVQERLMQIYGYDAHPVKRYVLYLGNVVRGRLGHSFVHGKPVSFLLANSIGKSLWLALFSFTVSLILCFSLLAGMAQRRFPWLRKACSAFVSIAMAMPPFIVAVLLLGIVSVRLGWLPQYGTRDLFATETGTLGAFWDLFRHTILPGFAIAIPSAGQFAAYLHERLEKLEDAPFVLSARGRGVSERRVFTNHQLRTLLPSFIQLCGLFLPALAGGVMVIEAIFGWSGMGALLIDSVSGRDYPLLLGGCIWCAALVIPGYEMADYFSNRWGTGP